MNRAWKGPHRIKEVHQEGRWYVLDTGMKANFERLKPWNPDLIEILPVNPDYEWEIPETEEEAQLNEEIQPEDPAEHESESEDEFEDEPMPEPSDRVLRSQPRVDCREPSEDEFYAVYEIKEEISFGEEHQVTFNVDLDESTDDASRRRKSDSEETVAAINDSVFGNCKILRSASSSL